MSAIWLGTKRYVLQKVGGSTEFGPIYRSVQVSKHRAEDQATPLTVAKIRSRLSDSAGV